MDKISVHLLGRPYVEKNGERVNFPYKKAEGFFYYLCVKKTATREEIIYVLWGADNENVGRKNLREAVYQIKKLLGKEVLLTSGHTSISLNPEAGLEVDWDHIHKDNILEQDEEGFLAHFHIKNSYEFEEWMASMQEQYDQSIIDSAHQQLAAASSAKDMAQIQKYSNILLKHDPYNEKLYQEIMEIYAAGGNYNMAIKLYYDLEKILDEELGVEPSGEITELFHRIFNVKGNVAAGNITWNLPFMGRTEEIYRISQCLAGTGRWEHPQCVAIGGEEGVGKSSLLEKARQMVKGNHMIPFFAACYRDEADFFLRPWNDIFWEIRQCVENGVLKEEFAEDKDDEMKRVLKGAVSDSEEKMGRLTYQIMEQAVLKLFRKITEKHRVVLFFDDIQWMDQMSFQLLNRILLTIGTDKVLLMCTYSQSNDTEIMEALEKLTRKDCLQVIKLQSFSREETNDILHKFLPQLDHEAEKKENIYQMTDGNAFFLMELINLIREKGYTLEISPKTTNLIKARLAGLPDIESEVLDCLSLFPEKISIEELELLLPSMDRLTLLRVLEKLQERHLVKEIMVGWNIYYKFVHRIFREYLYERQSIGKRRMYHQMLASYYEEQVESKRNFQCLPMIIHHYEKCHNQVKTYEYKIKYLKEYYTIIHENFPVLHWEIEYGDTEFGVTQGAAEMLELAEEVIRLNDDSHQAQEMKMEMNYVKGRYKIAVGEYEAGVSCIQKSIELANSLGEKKMFLNNLKQMIFYGIQVENMELVKEYVTQGLSALWTEDRETEEKGVFVRLQGWYLLHTGKYEEADRVLHHAMDIFKTCAKDEEYFSMSIAACQGYLGDLHRARGDFDKAREFYQSAIELGTGKVVTNGLGQFYSNMGQVLYLEQQYEKAEEYLEKAVSCLKGYGYYWGIERALAYKSMLLWETGEKDRAKECYEESLEVSKKIKNPTTIGILKKIEQYYISK